MERATSPESALAGVGVLLIMTSSLTIRLVEDVSDYVRTQRSRKRRIICHKMPRTITVDDWGGQKCERQTDAADADPEEKGGCVIEVER